MYIKNFEGWNIEKQRINKVNTGRYFKEREIWWCALGINIGIEIDGKNDAYERPVLLFKYINKDTVLVLPLTTKGTEDQYRISIKTEKMNSIVKISQMRIISTKRLLRKINTLSQEQYNLIKENLISILS